MSARHRDELPQKYPFRLVERTETAGELRTAVLLGSSGSLVRPGVPWPATLVVEAMAQSILLFSGSSPSAKTEGRLVAIQGARMLQAVTAGDRLEIEVRRSSGYGALQRFTCRALKAGALAAVAEITVSRS